VVGGGAGREVVVLTADFTAAAGLLAVLDPHPAVVSRSALPSSTMHVGVVTFRHERSIRFRLTVCPPWSEGCYPDAGDPDSANRSTHEVGGTDKGKSDRQVEFGDRVKRLRMEQGLSQEALAHAASINRTYIASLEVGRRNPSLDMMSRLAIALDVDLGEIVKGLQSERGRS